MIKKIFRIIVIVIVIGVGIILGRNCYQEYHRISGSARADMLEQIEAIEGEQHEGKCLETQTIDQVDIQIQEDMEIQIVVEEIRPWDDSMPDTDWNGNLFSKDYKVSVYECKVDIVRYATVDDEIVPDSKTHQYITYTAYEDRDLNSSARATVDFKTRECTYSDSKEYFENVDEQIENANDSGSK